MNLSSYAAGAVCPQYSMQLQRQCVRVLDRSNTLKKNRLRKTSNRIGYARPHISEVLRNVVGGSTRPASERQLRSR